MKELEKQWKEIEEKLGLKALEELKKYYNSLWGKIRDLTEARDNWKRKYFKYKNHTQNN